VEPKSDELGSWKKKKVKTVQCENLLFKFGTVSSEEGWHSRLVALRLYGFVVNVIGSRTHL
jgi:hypothetical protein